MMLESKGKVFATCIALQIFCGPAWGLLIRSNDGLHNNQINTDWGSTGSNLVRLSPATYADTLSTPRGGDPSSLANPRAISQAVSAQTASTRNERGASDWLWQWGQFLDHDLDLTSTSRESTEAFNIAVPIGDEAFDPMWSGTQAIPFQRSEHVNDTSGVRQQPNEITAYIDASNVYGSDDHRAALLREDEKYLRMTVGANGEILLGQNTLNADNETGGNPNNAAFFLAGDVRANEQIGLTAVHTLFAREHNRLVDDLKHRLDDGDIDLLAERDATIGLIGNGVDNENQFLFQSARKIVGAQIQKITYSEFLPVLLGRDLSESYSGYDDTVNAGVSNEFSGAAFRLGHTMLPSSLLRVTNDAGQKSSPEIQLRHAFFNPNEVFQNGVDSLLAGLAVRPTQAIDTLLVDDVRNFLFGPPGAGGLDLASLNIQRGRDHGLGSLNFVRSALGLNPYGEFLALTGGDVELAQALAGIYGDVDEVDLWIGGLAEAAWGSSMLGETFSEILVDQFMRSMLGDRFFYLGDDLTTLNLLAPDFMDKTSLANIIKRNSNIQSLQSNVFLVVPEPSSIVLLVSSLILATRQTKPLIRRIQ